MTELDQLSEQDLAGLIADASRVLERKREQTKRDVMAQMKALAASIGVEIEIKGQPEASRSNRQKVAAKYRDPANPSNAWSGRGMKPRWLQAYLDQGRSIDEFRV